MRQAAILIMIIALGLCSSAFAKKKKEKGPVAVTIAASADQVKAALVGRLAIKGFSLDSDTPYQMVFSKEMSGVGGMFTQLLLGNGYSERPRHIAYFQFVAGPGTVTVIGRHEVAVRMPLGNVNRAALDDGGTRDELLKLLTDLKADVEAQLKSAEQKAVPPPAANLAPTGQAAPVPAPPKAEKRDETPPPPKSLAEMAAESKKKQEPH